MLAKGIKAKVTAINVTPEFQMVIDEGLVLPTAMALKKRFENETTKRAKTIVAAVKANALSAGVKCDAITATSSRPYEAIIQQAKKAKCDLIVMASHGRKGLQSLLLGSETSKVLTHSL